MTFYRIFLLNIYFGHANHLVPNSILSQLNPLHITVKLCHQTHCTFVLSSTRLFPPKWSTFKCTAYRLMLDWSWNFVQLSTSLKLAFNLHLEDDTVPIF